MKKKKKVKFYTLDPKNPYDKKILKSLNRIEKLIQELAEESTKRLERLDALFDKFFKI